MKFDRQCSSLIAEGNPPAKAVYSEVEFSH